MEYKWKFDKKALRRLELLVSVISPSTEEILMARYLRSWCREMNLNINTDIMGNIYAPIVAQGRRNDNLLNLGIVAHMDTVAVQITNLLPNGMLQFRSIGLQPHTLLGQSMKVLTSNGLVDGVIGFDPTSQYGQPKGLILDDLWMDIGASNFEQACKMVEVGNLAVLSPRFSNMGNSYLSGTAIDNRIGLFILNECLGWFIKHAPHINLYFIGTVQ